MKKLLKLALIIGGIAAVAKLVAAKKGEWSSLTESQVREKLSTRLPDRIPPEKQAAVADKVVAKMRGPRHASRGDGSSRGRRQRRRHSRDR